MAVDPVSRDPKARALLALNRFGFIGKIGGAAIDDPRAALVAELDAPAGGQINNPDLLSSGDAARAAFEFRQERKAKRVAAKSEKDDADRSDDAQDMRRQTMRDERRDDMRQESREARKARRQGMQSEDGQTDEMRAGPAGKERRQGPGVPQQIYLEEAKARIDSAVTADVGLVERLVWFWSNHFCVSAAKGPVRPLCGAFEREAIRPHVHGKFVDMLLAVETHPAMLLYLDNARSMGPDSVAGQRRNKGLNENLAREIMELHTVGVRTGYSQDDVTNFAKVITGWTIVPPRQNPERGGEFTFNRRLHEPGAQRVMGREFGGDGMEQGRAVLTMLAQHPATAKHIATKLVRHFVADEPPQPLVERLAKRFLDTGGDLKAVSKAMIEAPEAWDAPRTKLRRPSEWLVNALRVTGGAPAEIRPLVQAQNLLGEPLWRPPAPNGFSDDSASWMDGLPQRLDIANRLARRAGDQLDPQAIAETTLGPLMSDETRQTLARAESRQQAMALLLMAPEFLRR